jgi:hypothetical protein
VAAACRALEALEKIGSVRELTALLEPAGAARQLVGSGAH